jgi:hypothetical protein
MGFTKVWNSLTAEWDYLDDEPEGMVVLNPHQQVEEHEDEDWSDLDSIDDE